MPTESKERVIESLVEYLQGVQGLVLADFTGLSVADTTEFRRRCREANLQYKVVKNRLAKRAVDDIGLGNLAEYLRGPTGVLLTQEDPIAPIRLIDTFKKEFGRPDVKVGWIEGDIVDKEHVKRLANLPSRDELIARTVAGIGGSLSGFVGSLSALLQSLVGTLDSIAKQKSQ